MFNFIKKLNILTNCNNLLDISINIILMPKSPENFNTFLSDILEYTLVIWPSNNTVEAEIDADKNETISKVIADVRSNTNSHDYTFTYDKCNDQPSVCVFNLDNFWTYALSNQKYYKPHQSLDLIDDIIRHIMLNTETNHVNYKIFASMDESTYYHVLRYIKNFPAGNYDIEFIPKSYYDILLYDGQTRTMVSYKNPIKETRFYTIED